MDYILVFLVSVLIICLCLQYWFKSIRNLPPGPWGLPILGFLPFINPTKPHQTISNLVKKYGKVISMQMGNIPCVILADAEIIRYAFSKRKYVL